MRFVIRSAAMSVVVALTCVMPVAASRADAQQRAAPGGRGNDEVRIDRNRSHFVAITDKAGFLGVLGHRHAVIATDWSAHILYDPNRPQDASVVVNVPVRALRIDSDRARDIAGLGSGPDADTVAKLQDKMLGPQVLDAERYATIIFRSMAVDTDAHAGFIVRGELMLHGRSGRVDMPVHTQRLETGATRFSGELAVRQSAYGIEPESVAGVVKVADSVAIRFDIVTVPGAVKAAPHSR